MATDLGVNVQWLAHQLTQPYTFGLFFEKIEQRQQQEGNWAQRWQKVEIRQAITELRLDLDRLHKKCDRVSQHIAVQSRVRYIRKGAMHCALTPSSKVYSMQR